MKETSGVPAIHAKLACGVLALLATLYVAPVAQADPPSTPSPGWVTDKGVGAIAPSGNATVYIGGGFHYMGPPTGAAAELPYGGGEPTGWRVDGTVYAIAPDGAGGWYVGGYFSSVARVPRQNLAHIEADGSVDPLWNPKPNAAGTVNALAVSGQTVYAGGYFTSVGGQPRKYLVALDQTGTPTAFNPSPNAEVKALALSGQTLYAGGSFTKVGETARNRVAAFGVGGVGLANGWNPNSNGIVTELAVSGSTVYLAGSFSQIGGQTRNRIAAVSASSGALQSWNPNAYGSVNAIEVGNGVVYVGGGFSQIGGQPRHRLAALSESTGQATAWTPTVTDILDSPYLGESVYSLELSGSTLYIGGSFYWAAGPQTTGDYVPQGQVRQNIAALDAQSGQLQGWDLNASGSVRALAATQSGLVAAGSFRSVGGIERRYLAEVDPATGRPTSWRAPTIVGNGLSAIEVSGQTIYIGGGISSVGGQPRDGLAALSAQTGALQGWNPTAPGETKGSAITLAASGPTVYVGGSFFEIAGQPRSGLAAFDASTGALLPWNPDPRYFPSGNQAGYVYALALSGPTLYVGGIFGRIGGQQRSNLAALDASTGTPTSWSPNPTGSSSAGWVNAIELDWPTVYVGGYFDTVGGQPRESIAAIDAGGALLPLNPGVGDAFGPNGQGEVEALASSGSTLYLGGYFDTVGGQPRSDLAALDTMFGTPTSWSPAGGWGYYTLGTFADSVYASGNNGFEMFTSAPFNSVPPQISGTPAVGQTLTVSNGTWEGEINGYRYQWLRDREPISGATASAYQLASADAGSSISAEVTASTLSESATVAAEPLSVGGAPLNTSAPRISGAPSVGRTLTASRGSWAGTPPLSYAYQWQRCEGDVGCAAIAGETEHRYVLADDDLGKMIRVSVTATNGSGSASANSAQSGAIAPSRSAEGPLADALPSESPVGPIAGTDPFVGPDPEAVAAVEQPNVTRKPYFAGYFSPSGTAFAPHGDPSYHVSTAVGDGLVFVGSQRKERVYAFDAATLAERYSFAAPGARGIAYADGELFVAESPPSGAEVGVYDAQTGAPKRVLVPPIAHEATALGVGELAGVSVAFGEAWLSFEEGPGGGAVMILDAQTGTLRAITWHFGRYDCSLTATEYELDPERCLNDASADTGLVQPAWWDISTTPDLGGAFAGCRFINREVLFSALAADDIYVGDASLSSDCAAGRYLDPNGVPRETSGAIDGTFGVPGMGWVLTMAPDASGALGSYVREYDAGSSLASIGAAELNLARSWRSHDHNSNNHRDIAYLNRDVRIDWSGELTDSEWQRGNRCLTYNVSDADIFVVGWRGERWYEPARTFQKLEVKLDGTILDTLYQPVGEKCLDLDTIPIPSGVHELTLLATLENGKQISITNPKLRIDRTNPAGALEAPQGFIRRTITIPGTMADEHAGPQDWQLQVKHSESSTWSDVCTDGEADPVTGKVQCEWNTDSGEYPDGTYSARGLVRDQVDGSRGGPNVGNTSEANVTVDNTAPELAEPAPAVGTVYSDTFETQVQDVLLLQTDQVSGIDSTSLEWNTAIDGSDNGQWLPAQAAPLQGEGEAITAWDTSEVPDGFHRIKATSRDQAGNTRRLEWQAVFSAQRSCRTGTQYRCYAGLALFDYEGDKKYAGNGIRGAITTPDFIPGTLPGAPSGFSFNSLAVRAASTERTLEVGTFNGERICDGRAVLQWYLQASAQTRTRVVEQPCFGRIATSERHNFKVLLDRQRKVAAVTIDGRVRRIVDNRRQWHLGPYGISTIAFGEANAYGREIGGLFSNIQFHSQRGNGWTEPERINRVDLGPGYESRYASGRPGYFCVHGPSTTCTAPTPPPP